ncbi:hypothetical protein [Falsiroseomonas sp.]|uniref:hypothetical protein n=1 Tax=Falsiroseomonas sp. TaxID=2870721 RepID=UPI002736E9B3|nr:hypothetical protein [Falsiroseomonas sp.]MDP3417101.1 hypothetical protein [Falsiroseomonas sp.]
MAQTVTMVIRDPVTDEVDYSFTEVPGIYGSYLASYVATATDYDLTGAYPWASYTVERGPGGNSYSIINRVVAVMDDGSTVQRDFGYFYALGNTPRHYYDTFTATDSLGRLDSVTVIFQSTIPSYGHTTNFSYKALDYDTATGRLNYSYTTFRDGHTEAIQYDAATGNKDYAVATYLYLPTAREELRALYDGRVVAEDFDATTGLLDYAYIIWPDGRTLSQDYDAQGRLDYAIERFADGRMIVTDYDLAGTQPGDSYSIAYDAAGLIAGTTVL